MNRHCIHRCGESLARKGVRVDPNAQITLAGDDVEIGTACYLIGRVHLGEQVQVGDYCRLENVTLFGATTVGNAVGLQDVSANDTTFESNPLSETLSEPVRGLATGSTIKNSTFDAVSVGNGVQLSGVIARGTVIPSGIALTHQTLGVPPAHAPTCGSKTAF